jgi:hypothetical protein
VGGQQYETLFVKGSGQDGQIIASCLPAEDIFWYLLSAVKMLWYYFLVVVLALVGYLMLSWWEGHRISQHSETSCSLPFL